MDSVNEEYFNQAVSYMGKAVTDMDQVNSAASGISIPADFSGAANVETAIVGVNSEIKPQVDKYATTFQGLSKNVADYIAMEKNAQAGAANLTNPQVISGFNGKAAALLTSGGIINLSSFKSKFTDKGTYYTWAGGSNTGLKNVCDVFLPNVKKIEGTIITFAATGTLKAFKNGEISTNSIVIFPTTNSDLGLSDGEAKNIAEDAKNIASSFGADPKNISVCGFSQGGSLVGSLVSKNDPGTFKTAIFASTRYGYKGVTDSSVKVITLIGSNEANKENGLSTKEAFDNFKSMHANDSEIYIVSEDPGMDAHMNVLPQALKLEQFNGKNIFDYAATPTPGTSTTTSVSTATSVPTPSPIPTSEPLPTSTQTAPSTPITSSAPTTTQATPVRSSSSGSSSTSIGSSSSVHSSSGGYSVQSTPAVPTNILPENKFTSLMPELKSGNLGAMEISTEQVKYEISNINDSDYNSYLTGLSEKGYTLSGDGTYWINGDNRIYVNYFDSNLTINLRNSTYL